MTHPYGGDFAQSSFGPWRVWHSKAVDAKALLASIEPGDPTTWRAGNFAEWHGQPVYLKASPLRRKAALRYRFLQWTLGKPAPRLREFRNLLWLKRHLFLAPEPLAAGVWLRSGLVRQQWLITHRFKDWVPWNQTWSTLAAAVREERIVQLAEEVARMHTLRFVHHDLFPRNVLVPNGPELLGIAFLDAWAGGVGLGLRGPAYDLACFSLDWPSAWIEADQALFLETYRAGREQQGRPLRHPGRFLAEVVRLRKRRLARESQAESLDRTSQTWCPPVRWSASSFRTAKSPRGNSGGHGG